MMACISAPTWDIVPVNRLPGDDGQILVVDRHEGSEGRTVCLIPGKPHYLTTDREFVRLLDAQDFQNARLLAAAPRLRAVLAELIEWAARSGAPEAPCWEEARAAAATLRDLAS